MVIAILVIIGGGLAGLAALRNRSPGNRESSSGGSGGDGSGGDRGSDPDAVKSDVYFYGDSPAIYPSRRLS